MDKKITEKKELQVIKLAALCLLLTTTAVGCSPIKKVETTTTETEVSQSAETEVKPLVDEVVEIPSDIVYGEIDGKKITRQDIEEELRLAEYSITSEYIDSYINREFFKDYLPTDEEVNAEIEKQRLAYNLEDDNSWIAYLNGNNYSSEEAYKKDLQLGLALEKRAEEEIAASEIPVLAEVPEDTDGRYLLESDITSEYEDNRVKYDHLLVDFIDAKTVEKSAEITQQLAEGKSLEEISQENPELTYYQDEYIMMDYDLFKEKPVAEFEAGEVATTSEDMGLYLVAVVKDNKSTLDANRDLIVETMIKDMVQKDIFAERMSFYEQYANKVKISGQETVKQLQTELMETQQEQQGLELETPSIEETTEEVPAEETTEETVEDNE